MTAAETDVETVDDMGMALFDSIPQAYGARFRAVVVQEGAVSSVFHIEGQSTIPSDNSSHKVSIAVPTYAFFRLTCSRLIDLTWVLDFGSGGRA